MKIMDESIIKEFNKLQKEEIEDADFVDLPNIEQGWTAEKEKKLNDIQRHIVDLENEINKIELAEKVKPEKNVRFPFENSEYIDGEMQILSSEIKKQKNKIDILMELKEESYKEKTKKQKQLDELVLKLDALNVATKEQSNIFIRLFTPATKREENMKLLKNEQQKTQEQVESLQKTIGLISTGYNKLEMDIKNKRESLEELENKFNEIMASDFYEKNYIK